MDNAVAQRNNKNLVLLSTTERGKKKNDFCDFKRGYHRVDQYLMHLKSFPELLRSIR